MAWRALALGVALGSPVLAPAGCADLPIIPENACGNRVIEPDFGEDCDEEGAGCGLPGTAHACRLLCAPEKEVFCPEGKGYGCGVDGVCRRHSGSFEHVSTTATSTTLDLVEGDVNADRCHEIMQTTAFESVVTAFPSRAGAACPASTQHLQGKSPEEQAEMKPAPLFVDLEGDGHLEIIAAGSGLLGQGLFAYASDGTPTLGPVLYPSARLKEGAVRILKVHVRGADMLLTFLEGAVMGAPTDVHVAAFVDPNFKAKGLGGGIAAKIDDIAVLRAADIDASDDADADDRCDEVLLGLRGEAEVKVYRICTGPLPSQPDPNDPLADYKLSFDLYPGKSAVALDGGMMRDRNATLAIVDADGDGLLDLVTNASDASLHVAHGDGHGGFYSTPAPFSGVPDQKTSKLAGAGDPHAADQDYIFVAGDFDAMKPGAEIFGIPCPTAEAFESPVCDATPDACEALVVDVDDDGDPDIVWTTSGQSGVTLQRGIGGGQFHPSILSTQCPPYGLAAGDFDGDGVSDIAFFDQAAGSGEPFTTLKAAYGNAYAAPTEPQGNGRIELAIELAAGHFLGSAPGDQLFAIRGLAGPMDKSGVSFIEGRPERDLLAPFYLPAEPMSPHNSVAVKLLATAAGRFSGESGDPPHTDVAVVTEDQIPPGQMGPGMTLYRLWLLDGSEGASHLSSQNKPTELSCAHCVLAPVDVDAEAAGRDELLVLGDHEIIVFDATDTGFVERRRFDSAFAFTSNAGMSYAQRPLIADLDGDGALDVVARATTGELVALWGNGDGTLTEAELAVPGCGGACGAPSIARLDLPADGEEVVIVGPEEVALYRIQKGKQALESIGSVLAFDASTGTSSTAGFTAVRAADLDGDGVQDLVVMRSSVSIDILRGIPVLE